MFNQQLQVAYILGAAVAGSFFWAAFGDDLTSPTPYRDVDVVHAEVADRRFHLVANFEKTDCTFRRLAVVGEVLGVTHELTWENVDSQGPDHDRDKGSQTLRIIADLGGRVFDTIEVRTRHDCEGELVDRVFMTFEVPE